MNWGSIAGNWEHLKGRAMRRWGRLTEDDFEAAASREASEKQLADWAAGRHDKDPIHK